MVLAEQRLYRLQVAGGGQPVRLRLGNLELRAQLRRDPLELPAKFWKLACR